MAMQVDHSDGAHLPEFLRAPPAAISASLGVPADQIRLVLCLVAAIPLGVVHRVLPTAQIKHVMSLTMGVFFCWYVMGWSGAFHPFMSSTVVYLICLAAPAKRTGVLTLAFVMTYMFASHIYRYITDFGGWHIDYTTSQMIISVKMCTFAYNFADGQQLNAGEKLSERDATHKMRSSRAILQLPSLLEYYSFIFFYGGIIAGPCFEIKEYLQFHDGTLYRQAGLKSYPSSLGATLKAVGHALVVYVGVFLAGKYPHMYMAEDEFFEGTTFWYRFGYMWLATSLFRFKYYFAWYMSEAGCIAAGLGFNGRDEEASKAAGRDVWKWDRVNNVTWWKCEGAYNLPMLTNNWNKGANNWLKNYVYFRVSPPKALAKVVPHAMFCNIVTKLISAIWHGVYPSYYLFFVSAGLMAALETRMRQIFQPMFYKIIELTDTKSGRKTKKYTPRSAVGEYFYLAAAWFLHFLMMNYLGTAFAVLRVDWALRIWRGVFYYFHVIFVAFVVVDKLFLPKKSRKRRQKEQTKKQE